MFSTRSMSRLLFVLGIFGLIVGVVLAREWHAETTRGEIGVIALIAVGFAATLIGALTIVMESEPAGRRAEARRLVDRTAWKTAIPPVVAGGFMLGFFAIANWYDNIDNPVASQLAIVAAIFGALAGILLDRITRWDLLIIPVAIIVALLAWGDRLPIDSESMSSGEIVTFLVIVMLIIFLVLNVPQIVRGRRRA